ncbi:MAG: helix-turn-helix transcriptional regulator [Clostridia bacterium]|nr:helix-turn-helix transcriptional regulator [Clostridia bacterium]
MVYFRIKELLKKNKKSKYWFIKNMEGGYQSLSHLMDNETKAIHFDTLEKMCDLFDCEIGELIVIKKDKRKDKSKKNE